MSELQQPTLSTLPTPFLPPGSEDAMRAGCCCHVPDNNHGEGVKREGKQRGWWMSTDCPLHGCKIPTSLHSRF